MLNFVLVLAN
jgi:hypothetical protein